VPATQQVLCAGDQPLAQSVFANGGSGTTPQGVPENAKATGRRLPQDQVCLHEKLYILVFYKHPGG